MGKLGKLVDQVISPIIFYLACGLGAVGVMLSMPRRRGGFAAIGALIAAVAGGAVVLGLLLTAGPAGELPTLNFYVFAALALGSSVRMITHPRPVYSALYFILTIIASSGMYVLLSAEFMAFALIIIYAGAILITYLFVIMLATQAPTEEDEDRLSDYDAVAREPIASAAIGFSLLAVLGTMLFSGSSSLSPALKYAEMPDETLARLPLKVERELMSVLREPGPNGEEALIGPADVLATVDGLAVVDVEARTVLVAVDTDDAEIVRTIEVPASMWPEDFVGTNVESLGLNLLAEHPMTIEIAGVILLMAMLGATVLARKQVDLEEELKRGMSRRLSVGEDAA